MGCISVPQPQTWVWPRHMGRVSLLSLLFLETSRGPDFATRDTSLGAQAWCGLLRGSAREQERDHDRMSVRWRAGSRARGEILGAESAVVWARFHALIRRYRNGTWETLDSSVRWMSSELAFRLSRPAVTRLREDWGLGQDEPMISMTNNGRLQNTASSCFSPAFHSPVTNSDEAKLVSGGVVSCSGLPSH